MIDEDGNWAVMDENAATGVDGFVPDEGAEGVDDEADPHQQAGHETLEKLLSDDPSLQVRMARLSESAAVFTCIA